MKVLFQFVLKVSLENTAIIPVTVLARTSFVMQLMDAFVDVGSLGKIAIRA